MFDFGLCKELREDIRNADGTYRLTENTGSPRYMAPEIARGEPYDERCDVYSFALLLWHMVACTEPYALYTPKLLREQVYKAPHRRPPIDARWPEAVRGLLATAWAPVARDRGSLAAARDALRTEVARTRGGDDRGLGECRRRSTFVFRQHEEEPQRIDA